MASAQERIEAIRTCMGTQFRVTVYAADIVGAQNSIAAAFARADQLDRRLSDYKPDSELNQLCRVRKMRVSEDLFTVLAYSQRVARESGGAFDVTLGPVIRLWREARRAKALPSTAAIAEARTRTGYPKLKLYPASREAVLTRAGMQLDLGGIAKGYAADEMLRVLREAGFPTALVAASGDLAIGDPPPGRTGWRVELGANGGEVRELRNCAVSTSGDESQYVEIGGVRYSHIVDPRTGLGLTGKGMVSIVAKSGIEADALATALSVIGRAEPLLKHHPGVTASLGPRR